MKKLFWNTYWFLGFFIFFGMLGCKKFVEIPPPSTQLATPSVFSSVSNATSAQTAIYASMVNESYNMALNTGMLGDELTNNSSYKQLIEYYTNSMLSKDITAPWTNAYNYIYQANEVINGLQTYGGGIPTSISNQLIGEAKFVRAFWDFYLTECYGAIPLANTPDYAANAVLGRTSQNLVYRQIITDLTAAESLLNSNYVDASDTTITTDRTRPTKWAAAALLARTYLFAGIYDSAAQQASLVIGNTGLYSLCSSLDNVFLANSSEAIWQIPPVQPSANLATPDGLLFILTTGPSKGSNSNTATISPQLMQSFDSNDNRKTQWISSFLYRSIAYYFPFKYKARNIPSTGTPTEYIMMLRLAEQYLIRAEAEAQQNDLTDAANDLNFIRNRAGLANYIGSMDQASILSAVWHERQVELFTEWGTRWFDLNRTNTINSVMSVVTPLKGGGSWNSSDSLLPIPLTELTYDPGLTQNPNY